MSSAQKQRWQKAQSATAPVEIVTLDEAKKQRKINQKKENRIFEANDVRDFAWGLP